MRYKKNLYYFLYMNEIIGPTSRIQREADKREANACN